VKGQLPRMPAAAMVQLPAVWILTGVTVALFGLRPRLAWAGWAVLAALGLLWTVAMSVELNSWLLNLSPFNHIPGLPGGEMTATPLIWLVAGVTTLVVVGLPAFAAETWRPPDQWHSTRWMRRSAGTAQGLRSPRRALTRQAHGRHHHPLPHRYSWWCPYLWGSAKNFW
jgi:hypothetical protein